MVKIARKGAVLCGVAGSLAPCQRFLDWFVGGLKGDPPEMPGGEHSAFGVLILPSDLVLTYGPSGWERTRAKVVTMGSGGDFAKGAISAGADAIRAVEIACMHDTKSGLPVIALTREGWVSA